MKKKHIDEQQHTNEKKIKINKQQYTNKIKSYLQWHTIKKERLTNNNIQLKNND